MKLQLMLLIYKKRNKGCHVLLNCKWIYDMQSNALGFQMVAQNYEWAKNVIRDWMEISSVQSLIWLGGHG